MRTDREGFGLVELLVVLMIVSILARIALPSYNELTNRARAAQVLGEINAIRVAAYTYTTQNGHWPEDVNRGIVPPELVPYLGEEFTFVRDHYVLDWENWSMPDGTPTKPGTGVIVGVSLVTADEFLGDALLQLVGDVMAKYTIGDHYTFVIEAT